MIKVMVIDDERNIREGILQLIDWKALGCEVVTSCANAIVALEYLQSNTVDIIVTDIKMPVMDGLELSRKIKEDYKGIKVIILTAYSDFSLAKQAIKNDVADFVVKNEFIEELPCAVKRVIETIAEERKQAAANTVILDEEQYYTQLFHQIIMLDKISDAEIEAHHLKEFNYCLCACEISFYDKVSDKHDLTKMLKNILKISLKECEFNVLPLSERYMIIVIRYAKTSKININVIIEYFNNIIVMIEEFMRIDMKFGFSQIIDDIKEIKRGYDEAREALARIVTQGCEIRVYNKVHNEEGKEEAYDVDSYMTKICELAFEEESEPARVLLKEFYDKVAATNCTFEQCQLYMLVICSSIAHKAIRYQMDIEQDFNEMEKTIYERIQNAKTIFSLVAIGDDIIEHFHNLCKGKQNYKNELVKRVDTCIRNHYKDEITLQFISNELYLNSSYLSRAYKKLTGITITEKITLYRVAKAKALLSQSNLKVYEVGQSVGIRDASYFTNVFVRYVGKSPTEYRQEHV